MLHIKTVFFIIFTYSSLAPISNCRTSHCVATNIYNSRKKKKKRRKKKLINFPVHKILVEIGQSVASSQLVAPVESFGYFSFAVEGSEFFTRFSLFSFSRCSPALSSLSHLHNFLSIQFQHNIIFKNSEQWKSFFLLCSSCRSHRADISCSSMWIFFSSVCWSSLRERRKKSSAPELAYFTTFTVWQRRSKKKRKKIRNFFIYSRALSINAVCARESGEQIRKFLFRIFLLLFLPGSCASFTFSVFCWSVFFFWSIVLQYHDRWLIHRPRLRGLKPSKKVVGCVFSEINILLYFLTDFLLLSIVEFCWMRAEHLKRIARCETRRKV